MNLSDKAMMVSLSISSWQARMLDRKATKETNKNNGAADDAGRYNKLLVQKESIQKINKIVNSARTFHYENTLPWKKGVDLLPAENYFDYMSGLRRIKTDFYNEVKEFLKNYDALVAVQAARLGKLFNISDYPSKEEIELKFSFDVEIFPTVDPNDFRVKLSEQEVESIREEIETRQNEYLMSATKDLWKRLYDVIQNLMLKMKEKKPVFRNTLVSNVFDLVQLLPKLNVTNDTELAKFANEAFEKLALLNPDTLRANPKQRKQTAKEAEEIIKRMEEFF